MKKLAHDTRAATSEIAGTIASLTREAEAVTSEIKTGVDQSRVAQSGFATINDTVRDVADIVALVDRQTDGIAQSTSHDPAQRRQREERPLHLRRRRARQWRRSCSRSTERLTKLETALQRDARPARQLRASASTTRRSSSSPRPAMREIQAT